jgi:galactose-1-phosphate uridylyltransferase
LVTWHRRQRDSWNLKVDVGFLTGTDTRDAILWLNVIMAELRKDPILGDWVILAPERALRPFDHEIAGVSATRDLCPFCRGNESATPAAVMTVPDGTSPDDWAVRIVPNRYPAVLTAALGKSTFEFTEQAPATGHHEVIIESPSHDQAMRDLSEDQVVRVVRAWRDRLAAVSREAGIAHTMIFKNEGAAAGASLEHVHSQLLATSFVPVRIEAELEAGQTHFEQTGKTHGAICWNANSRMENGSLQRPNSSFCCARLQAGFLERCVCILANRRLPSKPHRTALCNHLPAC